jgi:hypothetical protein
MVELLAAIVVFNLLVAGLVKLFIGQNSMVEDVEGWAEGEPVWYVQQESDPMARALGMPASLSEKRSKKTVAAGSTKTPYAIDVLQVERRAAFDSASVVFQQVKVTEEKDKEEDKKGEGKRGSEKKDKKGEKGKKGKGKK